MTLKTNSEPNNRSQFHSFRHWISYVHYVRLIIRPFRTVKWPTSPVKARKFFSSFAEARTHALLLNGHAKALLVRNGMLNSLWQSCLQTNGLIFRFLLHRLLHSFWSFLRQRVRYLKLNILIIIIYERYNYKNNYAGKKLLWAIG